jgi:hypothetical protein
MATLPHSFFPKRTFVAPFSFIAPSWNFTQKKTKIILQGLFGACILTIGSRFRLTLTLKVLHDKNFFAILNRAIPTIVSSWSSSYLETHVKWLRVFNNNYF